MCQLKSGKSKTRTFAVPRVWMCHWVDRLGVYMKSLAVIHVETGIPLTDNSLLHNGLDSRLRACEKMAH